MVAQCQCRSTKRGSRTGPLVFSVRGSCRASILLPQPLTGGGIEPQLHVQPCHATATSNTIFNVPGRCAWSNASSARSSG